MQPTGGAASARPRSRYDSGRTNSMHLPSNSDGRRLGAREPPEWTGDLADFCTEAWAGFMLRGEQMTRDKWWWCVYDERHSGQQVACSDNDRQSCRTADVARRAAELAARPIRGQKQISGRTNRRKQWGHFDGRSSSVASGTSYHRWRAGRQGTLEQAAQSIAVQHVTYRTGWQPAPVGWPACGSGTGAGLAEVHPLRPRRVSAGRGVRRQSQAAVHGAASKHALSIVTSESSSPLCP